MSYRHTPRLIAGAMKQRPGRPKLSAYALAKRVTAAGMPLSAQAVCNWINGDRTVSPLYAGAVAQELAIRVDRIHEASAKDRAASRAPSRSVKRKPRAAR